MAHAPRRRIAHLRICRLRCCDEELACICIDNTRYLTPARPGLDHQATRSRGSHPRPLLSPRKHPPSPAASSPSAAAHDYKYFDGECRAENVPSIDRHFSRIALVARMPSVKDKASQFSFHRHRNNILSSASPKNSRSARAFSRWIKAPHRFDTLLKYRLGCPKSDMPRVGEEQVFVTREKAPPGSTRTSSSNNSLQNITPTSDPDHSASTRDAEERGQDRRGSPTSRRGQPSRHSPVAHDNIRTLNVSQSSIQGRRAADSNQSDVKLSAPSAAYLEYQINQQLRYRKKRIVDSLMAAVVECIEKKLETLEEEGDGGKSPSSSCSGGFRSGKRNSQAAGQKRQHRGDDDDTGGEDGNDGDGDDGSRKNKNSKKAKTINDDTRLRFACPYYKRDPQKFKDHRTCLGPGWTDVHRVKEHLRRSHSLPPHQCHRCCLYLDKDDQLKSHQRSDKPCPIKDPKTVCRDLTDGYDQEQGQKLQKRVQKTPEEKWREWYCILFKVDDSSDIPSPYHEITYQNGGSSASQASNFQEYRDYYFSRVTPVIQHHIEQEVERAIQSVEHDIKSNVMDVIRDLPRRIMASIPPPGHISDEDNYDSLLTLDGIEFDLEDGYDFESLEGPEPLAASEFSGSSGWSDLAAPSSESSVEDDAIGADYSGLYPPQWKVSRLGTDGVFADAVFHT